MGKFRHYHVGVPHLLIKQFAPVESRMGAVAWAFGHRPVSHPRSSNRTCRFPASGFPAGFTARHATGPLGAGVGGTERRVLDE